MSSTDLLRPDNHEMRAQHERWIAARGRLWQVPEKPKPLTRAKLYEMAIPGAIPLRPVRYVAPFVKRGRQTIQDIAKEVAAKHGLRIGDMRGPSRVSSFVLARHEAFYRCRAEIIRRGAPATLPEIGRFFHRDHTTVLYGIRKHCAKYGVPLPC